MDEGNIVDATELVSMSVAWSSVGLIFKRPLDYEECRALANTLGTMQRAIQWWAGDLMNYAEGQFGEAYADLFKSWSPHTLDQWKWVSKAVSLSRRREALSWSHHVEVAGLSPDEQERWLAMAESEKWGTRDLRHALLPAPDPASTMAKEEGRSSKVGQTEGLQETIVCPACGHSWKRG